MRALLMPVSSFSSRTAAVMGFSWPPLSMPPCAWRGSAQLQADHIRPAPMHGLGACLQVRKPSGHYSEALLTMSSRKLELIVMGSAGECNT